MNKLLLTLFVALTMSGLAFADATNTTATTARAIQSYSSNVNTVSAIGDGSSGNTVEVDGRGSASVQEYVKKKVIVSGVDSAAVTGAGRLTGVVVSGNNTAAGDMVEIYDAASATGTPILEISMGTAKDTRVITIPGGIPYTTGLYVSQSADNMAVTVIYDE